jgi:hypothetical protein
MFAPPLVVVCMKGENSMSGQAVVTTLENKVAISPVSPEALTPELVAPTVPDLAYFQQLWNKEEAALADFLFASWIRKAKILAEAQQNLSAKDFYEFWVPLHFGESTMHKLVKIGNSPRVNNPAYQRYLPTHWNALHHIAMMKETTFQKWFEETEQRGPEWGRRRTCHELKKYRERIEPSKEYLEKQAWLERVQAARESRIAVEQQEVESRELELLQPFEHRTDEPCRTLTLNVAVAKGADQLLYPGFKLVARKLLLGEETPAVKVGALYFEEIKPDHAVMVVTKEGLKDLIHRLREIDLAEDTIQPTQHEYLKTVSSRDSGISVSDSSNFCHCGKRISANKETCLEHANEVHT